MPYVCLLYTSYVDLDDDGNGTLKRSKKKSFDWYKMCIRDRKKIVLEKKEARLAYNGNDFTVKAGTDSIEWQAQEEVRVYDEEQRFIGMYYYDGEKKCFRIRKMFLSQEERKG